MANVDAIILLIALIVGLVVLLFQCYLWILLARLLRLACLYIRARLDYDHTSSGN